MANSLNIADFLNVKDKPEELLQILLQRKFENDRALGSDVDKIITQLNQKHELDFIDIGITVIGPSFSAFNFIHLFTDTFSDLQFEIPKVIVLFRRLFEETAGDMASGSQYALVRDIASKQPQATKNLMKALALEEKEFAGGYLSAIYKSLVENKGVAIYGELSKLTQHQSIFVQKAAINALASFDYASQNQDLTQETISIFDERLQNGSDDLQMVLAYGYATLSLVDKAAYRRLLRLAAFNTPDVQYVIATELFNQVENFSSLRCFSRLLNTLTEVSPQHLGTIRMIDGLFHQLLSEHPEQVAMVTSFIEQWTLKSGYNRKDVKFDKLFSGTLRQIKANPLLLPKVITEFFNHDNFELHFIAAQIAHGCPIEHLSLDKSALSKLNIQDIIFICRKILGHIFDPIVSLTLLYSILDARPSKAEVLELMHDVFANHVAKDYLGTTLMFLEERLQKIKGTTKKKQMLSGLVADLKKHQKSVSKLEYLPELCSPKQQTRRIQVAQQKVMQDVMEQAQEQSVMMKICTRIPLKYNCGYFMYFAPSNKYGPINIMQENSFSVELPQAEVSCPVHGESQRAIFRSTRRGE